MKNSTRLTVVFSLLLGSFLCTSVRAQDICPDDMCGDLQVGFVPTGDQSVFCEGATISFSNQSDTGFDFFIVDWADGNIDTVNNYAEVSHQYALEVPDPPGCPRGESFEISFRGITQCSDGFSCHESSTTYSVRPLPIARMSFSGQVCAGRPVNFSSASCNAGTFMWNFGDGATSEEENPQHIYDTPGFYTVTLTIEGQSQCGDITDAVSRQIEVVNPPNSLFLVSDDDLVACRGTEITLTNQSNDDTNIQWDIRPGSNNGNNWMFIDTNMTVNTDVITVIFNNPGTYTLELTGSNSCDMVSSEQIITIEEAPAVNLLPELTACDELTITPNHLNFSVNGSLNSICWEFIGGPGGTVCSDDFGTATFTASGSVSLAIESLCGTIERTTNIIIQSSAIPQLSAQPEYCTGSMPDTLTTDIPGGNWAGPGITNTSAGVFDPAVAGAGTHTITYAITDGPCQNSNTIDVLVNASEQVTVSGPDFCRDSDAATLTANPVGGTWSGEGITDPVTGNFDPTVVTGPGTYQPVYSYTDANGCMVTASPAIEVFAIPTVIIQDTALVCFVDAVVSLTEITGASADVSSGNYSWTINGNTLSGETFNPSTDLPGPGVYPITFLYDRAPCTVPGDAFIEVIENPVLSLTPQENVCISQGTLALAANLDGGNWSGPGINPSTGIIDLMAAGGGNRIYTYTFQPGGTCEQVESQTITIEDPGSSISVPSSQPPVCEQIDLTTQLTGASPSGGSWSGQGLVDVNSGVVDLTQLTPGQTYDFVYSIESATTPGCNAAATTTLTFNARPNPNFMLDGSPCIDEAFSLSAAQSASGFSFQWAFGDGNSSNAANPSHTYTSGGTFTQTLTVTSPQGCQADTSATVYVTTPPAPAFTLDSTLGCAPFALDLEDNTTGDDFSTSWLVNGDTLPGGNQEYILDGFLVDTEVVVTLVAENFCGARTQVQSVTVKPYPVVTFGLATDDGCSPFMPEISNVTRGNPDSWAWDMGQGTMSTDSVPPMVTYTTPEDSVSIYPVTLIATNDCGRDTLTELVTVHPPDVRAFISLDTIAGCQPWRFQPQSFSTPGASLAWEVLAPDGSTFAGGNIDTPEFELTQPGLHRVILRAARCGEDADTVFVDVLPSPDVSFVMDPAICQGDTLSLSNTSGGIAGGFYDLGNGDTTNQLNTTAVYSLAGNYLISFTGFSGLNNCSATVSQPLVVNDLTDIAIAATDTSGCAPFSTTFSNIGSSTGSLTYVWEYMDGSNPGDTPTPTHIFTEPGVYYPTLSVTNAIGCQSDTFFSRITVHPDPEPGFTIDNGRFCARYDSLLLTDISVGATSLDWTINGQSFGGNAPVIPLVSAGQLSINLQATNAFGCSASTGESINVLGSPQALALALPEEVCLRQSIQLTSNSIETTDLRWNLGDDTGQTASSFTHTFGNAGDYTVSLIAMNNNGCPSDSLDLPITVYPLPEANYSFNESVRCGTPAPVRFTNNSLGAIAYFWSFGDGQTSTTLDTEHEYTQFGIYRPQLIAETAFGCRDTVEQELIVSGNPVADFVRPPERACSPYLLSLEAEPTEALRFEWYLDDTFSPAIGERFDTLLTENATYNIRLVAIYDDLCQDTLDVDSVLQLENRPVAGFTHAVDGSPNILGDVFFQSTSTGGSELFWDLGDGTQLALPSFFHEYRINRDITVTHAVTERYPQGLVCSDTVRIDIAPEWITTFFVPNAISPEAGPEEVRTWGAKGFGIASYDLEVYSATGQLVFRTSEVEDSQPVGRWDGAHPDTGELILQGVYSWRAVVEYVDGNRDELKGTVTVVR